MSDHPRLTKPATLDHLKKKKKLRKEIQVILENGLEEAVKTAENRLVDLDYAKTSKDSDEYLEAQEQLRLAREELDDNTVTMVFESIGRRAYEELIADNPPSEAQVTAAQLNKEDKPAYDVDSFVPALIAASCVEPRMTEEDAKSLFDEWTGPEVMMLFMTAIEVCNGSRVGELGKDYGRTTG